jgi:4-hydroxy-tetrahydrodipicolinate synthase
MNLRQQLRGTGVAVVTPFKQDESIDFDALAKVLDYIIAGGVEYVVTQGTTGETPTLEATEKKELLQFTYNHVNGRVPVVVGIGGNSTRAVCQALNSYDLSKAAAVLSVSPYYNKPSQEGIYQHYKAVAAASPKPIILYNVPGRTGRNMEPTTTLRLAHEVDNIGGIKEAGNSIPQCMQLLRDRPEQFLVVSGDDDHVLSELAGGLDGVISVAANCFPRQFSDMVRAGLADDFASATQLNFKLMDAYNYLFAENNPAGVKAFLYEQGLIANVLRLPVVPVSEALQQKIKAYLSAF